MQQLLKVSTSTTNLIRKLQRFQIQYQIRWQIQVSYKS